ncbi:MAG: DUF2341 domain-containing protein [Methanobacteriota archaeon]
MKKLQSIVGGSLVFFLLTSLLMGAVVSSEGISPEWRNQGEQQTTIVYGTSVSLYAQGRDDTALRSAWLATNETGVWKNYTGYSGWRYCKQIVIHHEYVAGDLTNFPVLITCTSPDFTAYAQPDGDDFMFMDETRTTKYNHEIEQYTSTTGELVAWVTLPQLRSTTDTVMYLYYGNPTCVNQENMEGMWGDHFILVNHLTGADLDFLKDSTSNHWDVTSMGGNPLFNQPGKIGGCVDFGGNGDYLKASGFRLPNDSSYTAGMWVRVEGNSNTRRYIMEGDGDAGISFQVWTNGSFKARTHVPGGYPVCYSDTHTSTSDPRWFYVCTRLNTSSDLLDVMVNGVSEAGIYFSGAVNPETIGLNIGTSMNNNEYWMNGRLDELRVSNVPRSDVWVLTEYQNMVSPATFFSVSDWSPLRMQENNLWQWSNFSWQNPSIPAGRSVGWRIYYNDTSGNIVSTPVMSFTVIRGNSPPVTPEAPSGSMVGYTGVVYSFSVIPVSDPDGDQVQYLFDWGDGSTSGWVSSLVSMHQWDAVGVYLVKVKARDSLGAESEWSSPVGVSITASLFPRLIISAPTTVVGGTVFEVSVEANGSSVQGVLVEFLGMSSYTAAGGQVNLSAPTVDRATNYPITASKTGFQPDTVLVTVTPEEQSTPKGWIYGVVSDGYGNVIEGAQVCAVVTGDGVTPTCTVSSDQGKYSLLVTVGSYTVEVTRQGYSSGFKHTVLVSLNEAIGVNFVLNEVGSGSTVQGQGIVDYAIQYGITEGIVGGEITVPKGETANTVVYDARLSLQVLSSVGDEVFRFRVAGPEESLGTVVVLRVDDPDEVFHASLGDLHDVVVEYDGVRIPMADDSGDLFRGYGNVSEPVWAGVLTESLYVLVLVPEFSEHEVVVRGGVPGLTGGVAMMVYGVVSVIVVGVLVAPFVAGVVRRRRYF